MALEIHHVMFLKLIFLITPSYIQGVEHQQLGIKSIIKNISFLRLKFIAILVVWLSVYNLRLHTLRPRQFSQSQHSYRLERYISVWLRFTNRDLIMGETSAGYISTYIPLWNVSMSRFSTSSSYDAAQFDIYLEYIYHNCYNHSVKGNHGIIMITL